MEIGTEVFVCTAKATGTTSPVVRGFGVVHFPGECVTVEMNGSMGNWVQVGELVLFEEEIDEGFGGVPVVSVPAQDVIALSDLPMLPDVEDEECPIHPAGSLEEFQPPHKLGVCDACDAVGGEREAKHVIGGKKLCTAHFDIVEAVIDKWEHLFRDLLIPDHDPDEPKPYPGDIQPGQYDNAGIVALLRHHKNNPEAIQFLADMMEK